MRYLKAIDVLQLKHLMPYLIQGTQNISGEADISERCLCHGVMGGSGARSCISCLMPRPRPMAPTSDLRQPQEPHSTARPCHGSVVTASSSHLRHGEGAIFSPQEQLEAT